jgi:two-component system KDP operon response regulator KdpE
MSQTPELILLDLGLPDGDGITLTKSLRDCTDVPIIIISARGREDDKVMALDAGADDYVTKPFGVNELLARIRVAFRHANAARVDSQNSVIELGGLRVDLAAHVVAVGTREVHLTPIEYKLVALLAQHAGKVLTHRHLLKEVWGPGHAEQTHYLRVRMAELRKKIEANPSQPRWLLTEPGVGYRLRASEPGAER